MARDDGTTEQRDEPSVPDWWMPTTADPVATRLHDPSRTVKRITGMPADTVLAQLSAAVEGRDGIALSGQVDRREDGSRVRTGIDRGGRITQLYRWTVTSSEGDIELVEERFWPSHWRYFEVAVQLLLLSTFGSFYLDDIVGLPDAAIVVPVLAALVGLVCWLAVLVLGYTRESPTKPIDAVYEKSRSPLLARVGIAGVAAVFAGLSDPFAPEFLLCGVVVAALGAVVSLRYQYRFPAVPDFSIYLPAGGTEYVILTAMFALPAATLSGWLRGMIGVSVAVVVLTIAIEGLLSCIVVAFVVFRGRDVVDVFRLGGPRYVRSTPIHLLLAVLGSAVGWIALLVWIDAWSFHGPYLGRLVRSGEPALLGGVLALTLVGTLPAAYLWSGVVAQAVGTLLMTVRLSIRGRGTAEPMEIGDTVSAPVVVLPIDGAFATGLSVGPYERILISEHLVEELEPDQVEAIVAHEHAHVSVYDDATLGVAVPFVASVLLLSQNVLLGLLDYREREFRADRYAARITSPASLRSALIRAATLDAPPGSPGQSTPGPGLTVGFMPSPPILPRLVSNVSIYQPLFTGFALSEAHPSVEERTTELATMASDG